MPRDVSGCRLTEDARQPAASGEGCRDWINADMFFFFYGCHTAPAFFLCFFFARFTPRRPHNLQAPSTFSKQLANTSLTLGCHMMEHIVLKPWLLNLLVYLEIRNYAVYSVVCRLSTILLEFWTASDGSIWPVNATLIGENLNIRFLVTDDLIWFGLFMGKQSVTDHIYARCHEAMLRERLSDLPY